MGFSKCGWCHRYQQCGGDAGLVRSSPDTSRTGELSDESFEQISSFSIVPEYSEARGCRRKQTDPALVSLLIGYFHSLLHVAYEEGFRKDGVFRMHFDCFPDTNAGGWKEDQGLHVRRQLFTELRKIEIALVAT